MYALPRFQQAIQMGLEEDLGWGCRSYRRDWPTRMVLIGLMNGFQDGIPFQAMPKFSAMRYPGDGRALASRCDTSWWDKDGQ
jgi:hypothetical protein